MRPLWLWLAILVPLAPGAPSSADPPSGWQAAPARLAALDPAGQQEQIREMVARLDRANRLVLDAAEIAAEQSGSEGLLERLANGRPISQPVLAELLQTIDRREKKAIEQLARRFRTQVYRTFRQRRGVFTRRRVAWSRVLKSWEEAGGRFEQQGQLIDWLELAIRTSTPGTVGPLPADPDFQTVTAAAGAIALQEPNQRIGRTGLTDVLAEPLSHARPPVTWPRWGDPALRLPAKPRQPSVDALDPPPAVALPWTSMAVPRVAESRPVSGHTARVRPPQPVAGPSASGRPTVDRHSPAVGPATQSTPPSLVSSMTAVERRRAAGAAADPLDQPASSVPLLDRVAPSVSLAIARPQPVARGSRLSTRDEAKLRPTPFTARKPGIVESAPLLSMDDPFGEVPAASYESKRPPRDTADMEAMVLASFDDPLREVLPPEVTGREAAPAPNLESPSREVMTAEPQTAERSSTDRTAAPHARVNIDELTAQIAGHNLALRALEAELDEPRRWDARRLGRMLDRLKGVVVRNNDLTLLREVVDQHQRALAGRLESPRAAVSQLAAKIFEARIHAAGSDFLGSSAHRRAELRYLDELSRQLAGIVSGG